MSIRLTDRELDVMAVVWDQGSATVAEVQDQLTDDLAYTTILTVFRGLEAKRCVRHESEGRAHRFYPLVKPIEVGEGVLNRLLDKVYQGSRELLIARLVSDETVSPDELKRIRNILDRRLEEKNR